MDPNNEMLGQFHKGQECYIRHLMKSHRQNVEQKKSDTKEDVLHDSI